MIHSITLLVKKCISSLFYVLCKDSTFAQIKINKSSSYKFLSHFFKNEFAILLKFQFPLIK